MLKKTITFTNFDGEEISEEYYFHLTKAQLLEMNIGDDLRSKLEQIIATKDAKQIILQFKEIILMSYGIRSPDGKTFIRNDALREEFSQTEAFSALFMELATNDDAASEFVTGIIPAGLDGELDKILERQKADKDTGDVKDARPKWEQEQREPTNRELQDMSKEELAYAFSKKGTFGNKELTVAD